MSYHDASGILAGVRNNLRAKFEILHEMLLNDKAEIVLVQVWKNSKHFSIVDLYKQPDNVPDNVMMEATLQQNSILVGDFNSPSTRWVYGTTTPSGRRIKKLIDENLMEVKETPPTFLSFARQSTRPDLVLVNPHISHKTVVKLLEDAAGCGYRALYIKCTNSKIPYQSRSKPRWNINKTDWGEYSEVTENAFDNRLTFQTPEDAVANFDETVTKCAHYCIPRGQVKTYRLFWIPIISIFKKTFNMARKPAKRTKELANCIALKKSQAQLVQEIK